MGFRERQIDPVDPGRDYARGHVGPGARDGEVGREILLNFVEV